MTNNDGHILTLIDFGLSSSQAKVYLSLLEIGEASVKEIAAHSKVARPDTYRAIERLQEFGIVEKIVTLPTTFRSLPIKDAVDILIQRKTKENNDFNKRVIALMENLKEKTNIVPPQKEEKLVLIPDEALDVELRNLLENTQNSICLIVSSRRMLGWLSRNNDVFKNALKRKINVRVITDEHYPLFSKEMNMAKTFPNFELRQIAGPLTAWFRIYDRKEVVLTSSMKSGEPINSAVWSSNHTLLELAQDYFDVAWFSAVEPQDQAFKHDRRQFDYLFSNMTSGFSYSKIFCEANGKPVDFVILETNASFEEMTGLGRKVLGEKATKVLPNEMAKNLIDLLHTYWSSIAGGKTVRFDYYSKILEKWLSILAYSPEKGYLVTIFEDITSAKIAKASLIDSEEKYRLLVELAQEGIWVLDAEYQTIFVNPKMSEMLDYEQVEMVGKSLFCFVPERGFEHAKHYLDYCGKGLNGEFECELLRKNSEKINARISITPINDANGVYVGILGLIANVSEQKKMAEKLEEYSKNLEDIIKEKTSQLIEVQNKLAKAERLVAIGQFAGSVDCDIRNPMQVIASDVYLAKKDLATIPESEERNNVQESLMEIEKNISNINKIVSDLQKLR